MSASHASKGLRPRSCSSASAMTASFSIISRSIARSCCLRHSMSRVRPVANVCRSLATVESMSVVGALTDSVVMGGVLPDPRMTRS
jgi:hypothetical protein